MLSSRSAKALRGLAVAAVTVLVPAVAGCEAGQSSPTQQWHQPTPGASATVHNIAINNVFVLGAPPDSVLPAGSSAGLFLALANDGRSADRLVSISAPGVARSVVMPRGGISLASQQAVYLQGPAPEVLLRGTRVALNGGRDVPVVLNFQNAGSITLRVPVMPRAAYYSTFSPAPTASPVGTVKRVAASSPKPAAVPSPASS